MDMFLAFSATTVTKFQRGTSSAGTLNTRGGEICDFRLKSSFTSETGLGRSVVLIYKILPTIEKPGQS